MEWSSLSETEQKALNDLRETVEDACSAETYHFEAGGKKHIEFHVDFLGGGSEEGRLYSVRFDQAAKAPCEHFYAPKMRKCHLSVYHAGQDEVCTKRMHARARNGSSKACAN